MKQFNELLKTAIGDMTQSEFARLTGIAPAQLNRYIKSKGVPSPETLEKIADVSDVSFEELMESCGHSVEEYKKKKENRPDKQIAREEILGIRDRINGMRGTKISFLDMLLRVVENGEGEIVKTVLKEDTGEIVKDIDPNASDYVFLTVNRIFSEYEAQYVFIVTFNVTRESEYVISRCFSDGKTLLKSKAFEDIIGIGLDELERKQISVLSEFFVSTKLDDTKDKYIRKDRIKRGDKPITREQAIVFCSERSHVHKLSAEEYIKKPDTDIAKNEMDKLKYNNLVELSNIYADIANLLKEGE